MPGSDNPKHARVFHFDLYGKREEKYDFLNQQSIDRIEWTELEVKEPGFFFVKKDFDLEVLYKTGFKINELLPQNCVGIVTSKDEVLINDSEEKLIHNVQEYYKIDYDKTLTKRIAYRTFDHKYIYYDVKIIDRARDKIMKHMLKPNLAFITPRQAIKNFQHVFISNTICDKNYIDSAGQFGAGNVFPLYLYPKSITQHTISQTAERTPNLNRDIVGQIAEKSGLEFTNEKAVSTSSTSEDNTTFAPIDILDYIYAVLHSPTYREKYKEFLKIDFPRVPYPKDADTFWSLVELGGELRRIHLLESPVVEKFFTTYPQTGGNTVDKVRYEDEKVWINEHQYFDGVPIVAWEFYIGGYQPAQKWLKDRKGRLLLFEDIQHYQKIIVALSETDRLMKEIDKIRVE